MGENQSDVMKIIVDGKDVFVPCQVEVSIGGYRKKVPLIDESNLIEVTTLGSDVPEFISY
ncbi:hypothetical protein EDF73_11261 [Raoultella sp. BIGb0138]|uniref:hypothetical protein n=1 Tax=Raoultella sp. BIGb0138 TaxID=2485115 RepID=UPI001049EFD8|nr:hypothetical protein [Raoultella sp. BIGb0138]TCW07731.1 hypothetical protein EDF73_11261 [Raoultella sp. BIGb0138]